MQRVAHGRSIAGSGILAQPGARQEQQAALRIRLQSKSPVRSSGGRGSSLCPRGRGPRPSGGGLEVIGPGRASGQERRPRPSRAILHSWPRAPWDRTSLVVVLGGSLRRRAQGGHRQQSLRERFCRATGQDSFHRSASREVRRRLSAYPAGTRCPVAQRQVETASLCAFRAQVERPPQASCRQFVGHVPI